MISQENMAEPIVAATQALNTAAEQSTLQHYFEKAKALIRSKTAAEKLLSEHLAVNEVAVDMMKSKVNFLNDQIDSYKTTSAWDSILATMLMGLTGGFLIAACKDWIKQLMTEAINQITEALKQNDALKSKENGNNTPKVDAIDARQKQSKQIDARKNQIEEPEITTLKNTENNQDTDLFKMKVTGEVVEGLAGIQISCH
jgi:uncharacterized coiled-coil DUF342 family protein